MQSARINDVDIAFDVKGDGQPVLLIHGAFVADALLPLLVQPALEGFQIIRYHRRGYGDSSGDPAPDIATHVADARALLEHLDATPAHVIGHSYGGAIALQLAAGAPELVRSLVLLEPGIVAQIPSAEIAGEAITKIIQPFAEGDSDKAAHRFMRTMLGRNYRETIEYNVGPNALPQAFADADDAFAGDLNSLGSWAFGADDAARIKCPTLFVLGGKSDETVREALAEYGIEVDANLKLFEEMIELGRSWIPQSDLVTLGDLNHALQMQDAWAVGVALSPFLAKQRAAVPA